jgi:hypothetical protein
MDLTTGDLLTKAKAAQVADAAAGDTRFQISGCAGRAITLSPNASWPVYWVMRNIPDGKTLYLKRVNFVVGLGLGLRLRTNPTDNPWASSSVNGIGDYQPNHALYTGTGENISIIVDICNLSPSESKTSDPAAGWWFDLATE